MTRPIVAGIIAEVLAVLSLETVVEKAVDMIRKIKENDPEITDDMFVFGYTTVDDLRNEPSFWDNLFVVNNIVAAYLESETMRVANPLFAAIVGLTQAQELFAPVQVRRFADVVGGGAWERKFVF